MTVGFKARPWGLEGDGSEDPCFVFNVRCQALSGKKSENFRGKKETAKNIERERKKRGPKRGISNLAGLQAEKLIRPLSQAGEMHVEADYGTGDGSFKKQGTR